MFLRWLARARQTPKHESAWHDPKQRDMHWRAILVHVVRLNGRASQRVIYLGGITESAILAKNDDALRQFWDKIQTRLAHADQLSDGDRRRIISALLAKVPRPSGRPHLARARHESRLIDRTIRPHKRPS